MRSGTSPRARMMKGEATWMRPAAAPALSTVRRSGRRNSVEFVIDSSQMGLLLSYRCSVACRRHWQATRPPDTPFDQLSSARPLHRTTGVLDRRRSLFTRDGALDGEHVVGIAFCVVCLPGKDRAHQLVIAGP